MLEVLHDYQNDDPSQRRPEGHVATGATKKGNKKQGVRAHRGSHDEDLECDEDEDEDEYP